MKHTWNSPGFKVADIAQVVARAPLLAKIGFLIEIYTRSAREFVFFKVPLEGQ